MKNILILFLAVTLIPSLQSCKKDKLEESRDLLVDTWNFDRITITDSNGDANTVTYDDTQIKFKSSGSYEIYEEGDKIGTGTWKLIDDGDKLKLTPSDGDSTTYDVDKLTKHKLILSYSDNGEEIVFYFTK